MSAGQDSLHGADRTDDEVAIAALARLASYERVVRHVSCQCPPLFSMAGVSALFAGRGLDELIRRPFIGRCELRERAGAGALPV